MAALLDNCRFNPTLGGTTDWTYSSAVAGYQSPTAAGAVTTTVYEVFAIDTSNNWEISRGACTITAGVPTFARTTVLSNSLGTGTASGQSGAGTKISFAAAPQVAVVAIKESLISIEEANSFTSAQQAQARTNIGAAPATNFLTNSLVSDVSLTSASTFFTGPTVAQGTIGTFFASGTVTYNDAATAAIKAILWDGTTVFASTEIICLSTQTVTDISVSGALTNPVANIRISLSSSTTTGVMKANLSGEGKDSTLTVFKIG